MTPAATLTAVIEKSPLTEYTECELNHIVQRNYCEIRKEANKISPYEELQSKNEGKLLSYVREWEKKMGFVTPLQWKMAILITLFHVVSVVWYIYTLFFLDGPKWQTILFAITVGLLAGFGVTAGAHRYWCHRSYKAKWPLQLILIICYSIAGQNNIYNWVRDHRVHHKFSETSADPHDVRRGFFFSHVGWLMMKKHPQLLKEGAKINMSDVANNPFVQFHTKYFNIFKIAFCFVIPTVIPVAFWGESWSNAFLSQPLLRYMLSLNFTWSVNSFAHLYGHKPYDRNIMPTDNWRVSLVAMGEGWHNYHHTFPWDYKAAELGYTLNLTTVILDCFARIGWAYELKEASKALVHSVAMNKGDGSKIK